jgi:hypothetical protein
VRGKDLRYGLATSVATGPPRKLQTALSWLIAAVRALLAPRRAVRNTRLASMIPIAPLGRRGRDPGKHGPGGRLGVDRVRLMNVTTSGPEGVLSGSIGCWERDADKHDGDRCFGIQPELLLRMAVIDLGETTLLTWARMHKDNPDEAFGAMFEQMLTSVRFR